jgi:hypothetical protein
MTKRKPVTRSEDPLVWETAKPKILLGILLRRVSDARYLLEGIASVNSFHAQICGIEQSLKACDTLFRDYSSRRIDYPSFETELRKLLTVALLDELKFLGCPDYARQDNSDEFLGSLPFPDKALLCIRL